MINYSKMDKSYYANILSSANKLQRWFHWGRQQMVFDFVKSFYHPGSVIVDLGCGNMLWNTEKLPVIGVDVNEEFLDYNLSQGTIIRKIVGNVENVDLEDSSCDIIVITEVLEHLNNPSKAIQEVKRLLRDGGQVICSVPYDTFFSLWRPLFWLYCRYRGNLRRDPYYLDNCGHVQHFSKETIAQEFLNNGFKLVEQKSFFYLTIFSIFTK